MGHIENLYPSTHPDHYNLSGDGLRRYQAIAQGILAISEMGDSLLVREQKAKARYQTLEDLYHRHYSGTLPVDLVSTFTYLANEAHDAFSTADFSVGAESLPDEVALDLIEDALNFHFCYTMARKIVKSGGEAVNEQLRSFFIHYKDESQLAGIKQFLYSFAEGIENKERVLTQANILVKTIGFQFGAPVPKVRKPKIVSHAGKWFKKPNLAKRNPRKYIEQVVTAPKSNQTAEV